MTEDLVEQHCKPCEGGVRPLDARQGRELLKALHEDWSMSDDSREISRTFEFPAYEATLAFTNSVAQIAIAEDHHPVMTVSYSRCVVSYTTHAINGLSDNDFICAAKIDRLAEETAT